MERLINYFARKGNFQFARFVAHAKAISVALPLAVFASIETKDVYRRGGWIATPHDPEYFRTGDVLLVCNRWFNQKGPRKQLYTLFGKFILRGSWDEVAVVVRKDGQTYVLSAQYDKVELVPYAEFLEKRRPRGIVRRATNPRWVEREEGLPDALSATALEYYDEIKDKKLSPWAVREGASDLDQGRDHRLAMLKLCNKLIAMDRALHDGKYKPSENALKQNYVDLNNLASDEAERRKLTLDVLAPEELEVKLFNASVVAGLLKRLSFFEDFGEHFPMPHRFCPSDFMGDTLPLRGDLLLEPIVIYKN
jgi:hypothetical protein